MIYYSELVRLNTPLAEMLDALYAHGGNKIELMMDGQFWDELPHRRADILKLLRARPIAYSVHPAAWDTNLTSELAAIREATLRYYEDCVRFAHELGADQVVIHPGFTAYPFSRELGKQRAAEAIAHLAGVAAPLGVALALENVGNRTSMLYTQQEFEALADAYPAHVGLLLDIGHAHITGFDIPALIRRAAPRLLSVHMHDNDGVADQHLAVGDGSIDFAPIFEALRSAREDCHIVLEYQNSVPLQRLAQDKARITGLLRG